MSPSLNSPPVVLTIGGSDCSAGAGVQADLKAIHGNGGYALTAVTGVVAETPHEVSSWECIPPPLLGDQIGILLRDYPVSAIKIGLLFNPEIVSTVVEHIKPYHDLPIIVDPVGTASAGAEFGGADLREALIKELFPVASLITPNHPEAALFLQTTEECPLRLAEDFYKKFNVSALLKGGHVSTTETAEDILWSETGKPEIFSLPWVSKGHFHGTGCTLASAITTHLALGEPLSVAITKGKKYLHTAMQEGLSWNKGDNVTKALR